MRISKTTTWQKLASHQKSLSKTTLSELFQNQPERSRSLSLKLGALFFDFSKQKLNKQTLKLLFELAKQADLEAKIQDLFAGKSVNITENRAALHTACRDFTNPKPEVTKMLQQIQAFVETQEKTGISDIVCLGIGGSALGPDFVCEALESFQKNAFRFHFLSNTDPHSLHKLISSLSPEKTLCLITSKTFTTVETLLNAQIFKQWLGKHTQHLVAITAAPALAKDFGVPACNIFVFWPWVGGRYSVWSAVGLSIALKLGFKGFLEFLKGAEKIDQHFKNTNLSNNIPVLLGLVDIWNINFLGYQTLAIMPYSDALKKLPDYLQQLIMESNGKSVNLKGEKIDYPTAPIIWGGVGCDGQHAFMQLLHQSQLVTPVEFILPIQPKSHYPQAQDLLISSCLSQSKALMQGQESSLAHKHFTGNRPSNTIILEKCTPDTLGSLLAFYEHRTYVQSVIWQINPFDQFGVELGKKITHSLLPVVKNANTLKHYPKLDTSTESALKAIQAARSSL